MSSNAGYSEFYTDTTNPMLNIGTIPPVGDVAGSNISCPGSCSKSYNSGISLTLTVTASTGYNLFRTGCNSNPVIPPVTMNAAKRLRVTFALKLKGDLNNDGIVDLTDAILALRALSGMTPTGVRSEYALSGVDVNGDKK